MDDDDPRASSGPRIAPGFGRRLAAYLFGIAIGLVLLGLFQQMRAASRQGGAPSPPAERCGAGGGDGGGPGESAPRPGDEQGG